MPPILDKEKAKKALDMNLIRPDQFQVMYPEPPEDIPATPQTQYEAPAGPEVAPDFVPYSPDTFSRIGEAFGYNPTATLGDLNPFGGNQSMREASAKRDQEAFLPPQQKAPISRTNDPYLVTDSDEDRRKKLLEGLDNIPGLQSYSTMMGAMREQGNAIRESSREQALEYQKTRDALEELNKDTELRQIARKTRGENALQDLEKMRSDLSGTKIDANRIFANMSTGDKILASIGLILGGFGAANGGGNKALAAMERAIDRDIADQKANYQVKKDGLEGKETLYRRMLEQFKNEDAATEATRLNMLKMAEIKLAEIGARYQDPLTKAKVDEQIAKLQLVQDQTKASFLNAMMGGDDPYKNMDEKQAQRYVPGYGFAPDPKLRDKAVEATTMADNTIANVNTILDKAKNVGVFTFGVNNEIGKLVQLLRSESREAILGPGTVQEAERALLEDLIENPASFFTNKTRAAKGLQVIRDAAARTRDQKLRALGVRSRADRFKTIQYEK